MVLAWLARLGAVLTSARARCARSLPRMLTATMALTNSASWRAFCSAALRASRRLVQGNVKLNIFRPFVVGGAFNR